MRRTTLLATLLLLILPVTTPVTLWTSSIKTSPVQTTPAYPDNILPISSTVSRPSDGSVSTTTSPPIGLTVILRSIFGLAFYNSTGQITIQPASLVLNMTVQGTNQTGILFSINSGRVTIGPSPIVSLQRVFDVISGQAFLYFYSRLVIQAQAVETGLPPVPSQLFTLYLTGPARLQPPTTQNPSYSFFTSLFGFLYNSQTKIGLFFIIGSPIWDLNVDGRVDIIDLTMVASNFGKNNLQTAMSETPSTTSYSTAYYADPDGDGIINVTDLVLVASHFGTSY